MAEALCNKAGCKRHGDDYCETCGRTYCANHYVFGKHMCIACYAEQQGIPASRASVRQRQFSQSNRAKWQRSAIVSFVCALVPLWRLLFVPDSPIQALDALTFCVLVVSGVLLMVRAARA